MIALDPLTRRLFPTVARYARKVKWLGLLAVAAMLFTSGLACGLMIGSYRGQVADESYNHAVREFYQFKEEYLKHHAKSLVTTLGQANDSAWKREVKANGNAQRTE